MPDRPLGGGRSEPPPGAGAPSAASAYPSDPNRLAALRIVALLLSVVLFRNVLFNDYRSAELSYLRAAGVEPDEIARYVPPTARERAALAKNRLGETARLRDDVDKLIARVGKLEAAAAAAGANPSSAGGDESPCAGAESCGRCARMAKSLADVSAGGRTCSWATATAGAGGTGGGGVCAETSVESGGEVGSFDCGGDEAQEQKKRRQKGKKKAGAKNDKDEKS